MKDLAREETTGILDETTGTIHKRDRGGPAFHTLCGISHDIDPGSLRQTPIERATESLNVTKCGRCFPGVESR